MKILVEIDLKDVEPNDVYKSNSNWFNISGFINIELGKLDKYTKNSQKNILEIFDLKHTNIFKLY
jgi:hypothetical protein